MNQELGITNKESSNVKKFISRARDLEIYKKAFASSIDLHKISLDFPKNEQYELASQIRRASKSICANLAEGFAKQKYSKPEFKRFIYIAIGSCEEIFVWLDYCKALGYVSDDKFTNLTTEYEEINAMLNSLYNKIHNS